jgi:hypothetical protein
MSPRYPAVRVRHAGHDAPVGTSLPELPAGIGASGTLLAMGQVDPFCDGVVVLCHAGDVPRRDASVGERVLYLMRRSNR